MASCHSLNINVDSELFISEIKARPAIWNCKDTSYSNRTEKHKAWEEIGKKFINDYGAKTVSERNLYVSELQKKWKHLRNCYTRELNKQQKTKKNDSASDWRKKYRYYHLLSFLSSVCYTKPPSTPLKHKYVPDKHDRVTPEQNDSNLAKKTKMTEDHELFKELSNSIKNISKEDNDDPDKQFLMSLLPDFKGIPQNLKIDAKFEIMSILHKYSRPQALQQYYPTMESQDNYEYVDVKFPFQDASTSKCEESSPSPSHSQTSDS